MLESKFVKDSSTSFLWQLYNGQELVYSTIPLSFNGETLYEIYSFFFQILESKEKQICFNMKKILLSELKQKEEEKNTTPLMLDEQILTIGIEKYGKHSVRLWHAVIGYVPPDEIEANYHFPLSSTSSSSLQKETDYMWFLEPILLNEISNLSKKEIVKQFYLSFHSNLETSWIENLYFITEQNKNKKEQEQEIISWHFQLKQKFISS